MKQPLDPLYAIFERYLYNSFLEEENSEEFVAKVVSEYLAHMQKSALIPARHVANIETDLKEEVTEMLRKKTYGHFNLKEFRKAQKDEDNASLFKPRARSS